MAKIDRLNLFYIIFVIGTRGMSTEDSVVVIFFYPSVYLSAFSATHACRWGFFLKILHAASPISPKTMHTSFQICLLEFAFLIVRKYIRNEKWN